MERIQYDVVISLHPHLGDIIRVNAVVSDVRSTDQSAYKAMASAPYGGTMMSIITYYGKLRARRVLALFNNVPFRSRRALVYHCTVYGNSALLVLNRTIVEQCKRPFSSDPMI